MIIAPLGNPNLGVILRPVITNSPLPIELSPQVSIVRLPEAVLEAVRPELVRLNCTLHTSSGEKTPFEALIRPGPVPRRIEYDLLDEANYRYTALLCDPKSTDPQNLFYRARDAIRLVETELAIGFVSRFDPPAGLGWSGGSYEASFLSALTTADKTAHLTDRDLEQARSLVGDMLALDAERFAPIKRSVELFADLDYVPNISPLWVLGHFIVWEALLTHNPDPDDPQDSLTRQLRRCIPLLEHRLVGAGDDQLDQAWSGGMKLDRIISKLYDYRSAIAHGEPHFDIYQKEPFKKLSWPGIDEWIRTLTKRLLRAALREPQLVMDLRGPV